MKPQYINGNMQAPCPDCGGAVTTFESKTARGEHGVVHRPWNHIFEGKNYTLANYILMRCAGCGRGGVAIIHGDAKGHQAYDEAFYPSCRESAPIPKGVPPGVEAEYRESELCASAGAWRAGSALLRSALEKTLRANGYTKGSLKERIDDAAKEGVITAARRQRAQDEVRVLGNDVMHDEWREVREEEYSLAHHYVQRILEDLYDHRGEVEAILQKAGRLQPAKT
jgi:Domain of unknown function (DUF4145)